jgi:hypothetical protein
LRLLSRHRSERPRPPIFVRAKPTSVPASPGVGAAAGHRRSRCSFVDPISPTSPIFWRSPSTGISDAPLAWLVDQEQ